MPTRALITGGAGFIGSHLSDKLLRSGYAVRILDSLLPQVHGDERKPPSYLDKSVELCVGDVRDPSGGRTCAAGSRRRLPLRRARRCRPEHVRNGGVYVGQQRGNRGAPPGDGGAAYPPAGGGVEHERVWRGALWPGCQRRRAFFACARSAGALLGSAQGRRLGSSATKFGGRSRPSPRRRRRRPRWSRWMRFPSIIRSGCAWWPVVPTGSRPSRSASSTSTVRARRFPILTRAFSPFLLRACSMGDRRSFSKTAASSGTS